MSTELLADCSAPVSAQSVAREDQVDVALDDLIIGRPLTYPIFDDNGVLLLAEGSLISSEFKRLLKQRGTRNVLVHNADAGNVALTLDDISEDAGKNLEIDQEIASQLDRVIESGLMQVHNHGPAMRENVVAHGRKAYDLDRHDHLELQRTATCESLTSMMKEAVRGKSVTSTVVTQLAASYLSELADDADNVISVAMQATNDPELSDHCLKMATLGMAIGVEMGLNEDNCKRVCVAGLVHDWGMARVPASVRNAERRLTETEFLQVQKHPIFTAEMLERMPGIPSMVPVIAYQVHERMNGLGYPRRRSGDRVHPFARILAVADTYAALTEPRPYRAPLMPYAAMECLVKLAKSRDLDPEVVRALLQVMSLFPIGSFVTLSDGSVAKVLRRNGNRYSTPIAQLIRDGQGQRVDPALDSSVIDLADHDLKIIQALPTPGRQEQSLTDEILYPTFTRN